jgi:surface polysaccharide O-acyltransferase-like enzyme
MCEYLLSTVRIGRKMHKTRIDEIDILRGFTFLAIVMQHTLAHYIYSPDISRWNALGSAFLLVVVRFAVPMFIFITGLVLFYNYNGDEFNYWSFLKKRFTQILVPYFIWTVIYFVWFSFMSGVPSATLGTIVIKIMKLALFGEGYYHLWFMVTILQFYLFFPLFRVIISKNKVRSSIILSICFLFQIWLMWFYMYNLPGLYDNIQSPLLRLLVDYRDRNFISWLFYFLLGGFAGLYVAKLRNMLQATLKINILVYLLSFTFIFYKLIKTSYISPAGGYIINYQFTGPLNYMLIIFLSSSLLLIYYLSQNLFMKTRIIREVLNTFGRYSFGCYFVHALILFYITAFTTKYLNWLDTIGQVMLSFAACCSFSLFACFLLSKITFPMGNLFVGKISPETKGAHAQVTAEGFLPEDYNT